MPVILNARRLSKRFGAVTAAHEVSAAIDKDSVVGLIGTNGAGKATFINMITGYLKPDAGAITYEGRDITPLACFRLRPASRRISIVTPNLPPIESIELSAAPSTTIVISPSAGVSRNCFDK